MKSTHQPTPAAPSTRRSKKPRAALPTLALATALAALAIPAAHAQEVTLKVAHFLPANVSGHQKVLVPWCADIARDSQGRIACQFYPAMQLGGTPAQLVDQVKNGVADVVWTVPGYSAGRFPAIEAMELPFVISDASRGGLATWQYYQRHAQKEFDAYKVLAMFVDGGVTLHTGRKEIKTPADIEGLKLRAPGRMASKTLAALGGQPVAMPPAQMTEAISKGVVDGAMGGWEFVPSTKLDEVTRFHVDPPAGQPFPVATVLTILMNKAKYERLPDDLKAVIDKHSGEALVTRAGRNWDDETEAARAKVLAGGGKIHRFSEDDMRAMRAATAKVDEEWIAEVSRKGLDGKTLAAAARELAAAP